MVTRMQNTNYEDISENSQFLFIQSCTL